MALLWPRTPAMSMMALICSYSFQDSLQEFSFLEQIMLHRTRKENIYEKCLNPLKS